MRVEIVLFIGANAKPETRSLDSLQTLMGWLNPDFEDVKHFAYGCNCNIAAGGWTTGLGQPVDELDATCKSYQRCLQCVTEKHGPECEGKVTTYSQSIKYSAKLFESF
mgnify:CR=1 FL=1